MNEKGFTLVETLVALVVGAMLLGSISWVISGLVKDLKVAEASDHVQEFAQASAFLNRALMSARFADQDEQNLPRSENSLTFEMPAPGALRKSGYVQAKLSSELTSEGQALMLGIPDSNIPATKLLDNAKSISLGFVESAGEANPGRFLREIKISVLREDQTEPNVIKIHPKIDSVGACVFDVISQRCRT